MSIDRFTDGSFGNAWPPPRTPGRPGVYRITIQLEAGRLIYIGESARVFTRVKQHAQGRTRLSIEIRKALKNGRQVSVDTVVAPRLQLRNEPTEIDMRDSLRRRLVESVAIAAEDDSDEQLLIMNSSEVNEFWLQVNRIGVEDGDPAIDETTY
jgi:hypothetical protein